MKKRFALVLFVLCVCLSACNKYEDIERANKDSMYNMVYSITRARYDKDIDEVYKYVPDIFISKEMKNKYVDDLMKVKENLNDTIGIQNVIYKDITKEERKKLVDYVTEKYSIKKEKLHNISREGIIELDVLYYDKKRKKNILQCKNFGFIYENKWYIIVIEEKLKK